MIEKLKNFRRSRWLWVALGIVLLPCAAVAVMLWLNGVDTSITDADRAAIGELGVGHACDLTGSFDAELHCIETVQETVFERYPDTNCAFDKGQSGHRAADYAARGYGCCYDRATLIEQTLRHHDFEVRRVGIYQRQSNPLNYLKPGISSHALSEVKTERGWLTVESLDPFLAVTSAGQVFDIADLRDGLQTGRFDDETFGVTIPSNLFDGEFIYARGVYSRHGYFFEPHLPVPEIDWGHFRPPA